MKSPEPRYQDRKGISDSRNSKCEKSEGHKKPTIWRNYVIACCWRKGILGQKLRSEVWEACRECETFFKRGGGLSSVSMKAPSHSHVDYWKTISENQKKNYLRTEES